MTVWLGGPAGAEELFLAACARAGIPGVSEPVLADAGIRCAVRIGGGAVGPDAGCDVLVALDAETLARSGEARRLVLYDGQSLPEPARLSPGAAALSLPGADSAAAAASLAWLAGAGIEALSAAWSRRLRGESSESAALKIQAARRACEAAAMQLGTPFCAPPPAAALPLVSGAQALGLGALAAGCTCLFVPDAGRARGPGGWLLGLGARAELASLPAADEAAALAAAAGAAAAGARALADLTSGSLACAARLLESCAECGLPIVVLAADDGWRWPGGLPVAELRPADLREARRMTAEAFNIAESCGVPAVVRAGPGLLGRWETLAPPVEEAFIVRGSWAAGAGAGPEARVVPGLEGPIRVLRRLPADVLARRRAALDEGAGASEETVPETSPLFPVPAAATLEEREPRSPEDFLPEAAALTGCAAGAALGLLARAWSGQGVQPKDIFIAAGGSCCLPEPLFPRTYGARVPPGAAIAAALGAKLANPALTVAAFDDGAAVFSRGLAQLLHAARGNHDISGGAGGGGGGRAARGGASGRGLLFGPPARGRRGGGAGGAARGAQRLRRGGRVLRG
jgi:hypothetical protein